MRDYFFYADGFEKDLDFYAAHAFTVEPLPRHLLLSYPYPAGKEYPADAEHLRYQLDYNTRQRSDRLPPDLRYHYSPNNRTHTSSAQSVAQRSHSPHAHSFSANSASRIASNSFFFALSTSGNARSNSSSASTIADATTSRVNHLLSAGTTYHGACLVAVFCTISSYASW